MDTIKVIHEEYAGRVSEKRCFRRHIISREQYERMTGNDERRWWKAREVREYTYLGYCPVRWSRRRWGDGMKVIDLWHIVKEVPADFVEIDKDIDVVAGTKKEVVK